MSAHTPGPWMQHGGTIYQARKDSGKLYAETAIAGVFSRDDARLIAAAPDLLAVVSDLIESADYWSEYDVPIGIVDRMKSAIAKATGEQQ